METRKCSTCKEELTNENTYKKGKIRQSYCRKCFNKICMDRWIKRKSDAIEYKGGKCLKCGYNKYYGALQFHHRDPKTKEFNWTKLRLRSWDKIIKELDKCDLLCANCHSELHGETAL